MQKNGKARDRVLKARRQKLCVGCMQPLGDSRAIRGLHATTCYHAADRLIRSGQVTEAELVEAGRMLERGRPGPKPRNPLTVEYSR